jgi:acetyl-CoA C-acetyltransferase
MRNVAVIGVGQTHHKSKRTDVSVAGLIREAVGRALLDAEIEARDVDAIVLGTAPDVFEGVTQPEQSLAGALFAAGKPILRLHTAGSVGGSAAVAAATHVASGLFDTVLAVGFEKHSETAALRGLSPKTGAGRLFLAGAGGFFAPYCRLYRERSGAPDEAGARVVVKARKSAAKNPYAHLREPVTAEEVLASPLLWDPLHRLECCPTSDGAACMIFASERIASGRPRAAWVKGAAAMAEAASFPRHDTGDPEVGRACAHRVYAQAGIADPRRDLDVAEIYEPFSWIELMWCENLGLADRGSGWRRLFAGDTELGGALPVNPSGGVLSTNPIGASGMLRMLEAASQVAGKCGEHQVDGARRALGHAYGGSSNYFAMMVFGSAR